MRKNQHLLTTVSLPIKVVFGIAMALVLHAVILSSRAMREGYVVIGNVVEEVNLLLGQHQRRSDGMHRSIAPSFIEEAAVLVKLVEVINISLGSEPVEVANLKVGPHVAMVVGGSTIVAQECH